MNVWVITVSQNYRLVYKISKSKVKITYWESPWSDQYRLRGADDSHVFWSFSVMDPPKKAIFLQVRGTQEIAKYQMLLCLNLGLVWAALRLSLRLGWALRPPICHLEHKPSWSLSGFKRPSDTQVFDVVLHWSNCLANIKSLERPKRKLWRIVRFAARGQHIPTFLEFGAPPLGWERNLFFLRKSNIFV